MRGGVLTFLGKKWVGFSGFCGAGAVWPWLVAGSMAVSCTVCVVPGAFSWCRRHGWWLVAGVRAGAGAMAGGWWLGRWLVRCVADG